MAVITKAAKEDFIEIHKLLLGIFPHASANLEKEDEFFVARNPEIAGFAHYKDDGKRIILKGLGVAEASRKSGLGGRLLDAVLSLAARERRDVFLKTKIRNPALRMYLGKGFVFKRLRGETLTMVRRVSN